MPAYGKRRALGQHFLRDTQVCATIVDEAWRLCAETQCDALLEIGPGRGALTDLLLEKLRKNPDLPLTLAERDAVLIDFWKQIFTSDHPLKKQVRILEGDFLDTKESDWLQVPRLGVMSNLPYSAGTAIVTQLAEYPSRIPFMVLMFQAEVAQRLRAEQGTKAWGSLSIFIQNQWNVTKLVGVPPRAFMPPPDVHSEVVVMRARENPHVVFKNQEESLLWTQLLKLAFSHRRKMLRSSLPHDGPWRRAFEKSGIDGTLRAEALNWDQWRAWFKALSSS